MNSPFFASRRGCLLAALLACTSPGTIRFNAAVPTPKPAPAPTPKPATPTPTPVQQVQVPKSPNWQTPAPTGSAANTKLQTIINQPYQPPVFGTGIVKPSSTPTLTPTPSVSPARTVTPQPTTNVSPTLYALPILQNLNAATSGGAATATGVPTTDASDDSPSAPIGDRRDQRNVGPAFTAGIPVGPSATAGTAAATGPVSLPQWTDQPTGFGQSSPTTSTAPVSSASAASSLPRWTDEPAAPGPAVVSVPGLTTPSTGRSVNAPSSLPQWTDEPASATLSRPTIAPPAAATGPSGVASSSALSSAQSAASLAPWASTSSTAGPKTQPQWSDEPTPAPSPAATPPATDIAAPAPSRASRPRPDTRNREFVQMLQDKATQAAEEAAAADPKTWMGAISKAALLDQDHQIAVAELYKKLGQPVPQPSGSTRIIQQIQAGLAQDNQTASTHTEATEALVGLATGYSRPKVSDPASLVSTAKPLPKNQGAITAPDIEETNRPTGPVGTTALDRPHLESESGPRTDGGPAWLRDLNPPLQTAPRWNGIWPPHHGVVNADGLYWSDNYGKWVGKDVFQQDDKIKADAAKSSDIATAQQEKAWRNYEAKTASPTFDQQLQKAATDYKNAVEGPNAREEILAKTRDYLSPDQLALLDKQMNKAIDQGASAEQLKTLAKKMIGQAINEHAAEALGYEADELDWAEYEKRAEGVYDASAIAFGPFSLFADATVYGLQGYYNGDAWAGIKTGVARSLPTATRDWYREWQAGKGSLQGGLWAMGSDALTTLGLFGDAAEITGGIRSLAKSAQVGALAADIQKIDQAELDFLRGRVAGTRKVDEFRSAMKLGNANDVRDAALEIIQDKNALQVLKRSGDAEAIKRFNTKMDEIYEATRKPLEKDLLAYYQAKMDPTKIDRSTLKIEFGFATNPTAPGKVKPSFDKDWSAKVTYVDQNGKTQTMLDVPDELLKEKLAQRFYEAAGSPPLSKFDPTGINSQLLTKADGTVPSSAEVFARKCDQTAVDRLDAEAYGHSKKQLESVLYIPAERFLGDLDLGHTFKYKGSEWMGQADKFTEAAKAAAAKGDVTLANRYRTEALTLREEGCRQWTKQWEKYADESVAVVKNAALGAGVKPPLGPSARLDAGMKIVGSIGDYGPDGRIVTPELADQMCRRLGFTGGIEGVGKSAGDYLLSVQSYVKQHPTVAQRLADRGQAMRIQLKKDPNYKDLEIGPDATDAKRGFAPRPSPPRRVGQQPI